ncbi:MAG: NAD-dependent epimerase/dehydratase family protein [Anaerolineae bacterium]|nr:NAD-dependent epimerase/dehydratase family protein [Anaerolineae bacterium]
MIFVTGGTGFLGRHLVPALCREGYHIRLLTRDPESHPWLWRYPRVEIIRGDLTHPETYASALQDCRYVVHAGGIFRMWGDESQFFEANVEGSLGLMDVAASLPIERFIHISTVAVIGKPAPDRVIDETYPPSPLDAYQRSKLQAERNALRYCHEQQLPVVVLRPGAFYGPMGHYAFNRLFFKDPMRGIIMQVDGGRYIIFPVYIADVAKSIVLALKHGQVGEIYNICGDWITHREAFDIICEEAQLHWPRIPMPHWLDLPVAQVMEAGFNLIGREPFWPMNLLRSYVHNNWRVSSEKARRELGFEPIDFREGARRTIAWYQAAEPENLPELNCD